jgi:hypothetical protein
MLAERIRLMETDLERIKGVHSARIRAEGGEISEIHVVADAARRPKMIVRDVVTTLFARYGVRVPHQRVSVAGSAPDPVAEPRPTASGSETGVQIASVHLTCEGEDFRATVELRDGQRAARATADAIATRANQSRVVAEAALEALRKLTGTLPPTQIEEVRSVELGDLPVVLVRVVVLSSGREQQRVGCGVGVDRIDAAAVAVLDAMRPILPSSWAPEEEIELEVEEGIQE